MKQDLQYRNGKPVIPSNWGMGSAETDTFGGGAHNDRYRTHRYSGKLGGAQRLRLGPSLKERAP